MNVFLSHQTALESMRVNHALPYSSAQRRCRVELPDSLPDIGRLAQPGFSGLALPLHVMVGKDDARRTRKTMKVHMFTGQTPEGCFVRIDDGIIVSSPEFCFLQMANLLPLAGLIELGYELCGTYSIPAAGDPNVPERGFHIRRPLTSAKRLAAFLDRMPGAKGHQNAVKAAHHILEGSASPMETKLSIILTLPYRLGGFGFPSPELNRRVVPSKTDKRFSSKESYVLDLFWPSHGFAVEYDSAIFHTGQKQIANDLKKKNALAMMDITVVSVTKQQLYGLGEFRKTAGAIAKCLGKRLKCDKPGFADAHSGLRRLLLDV